jgi:murein DD-endopeptidase MepM/ murein hydrolase activator NlpD
VHASIGRDRTRAAQPNDVRERRVGAVRPRALAVLALAAALPAAPAMAADGGGAALTPAPAVTTVSCLAACNDLDVAAAGSTLRITGKNIADAKTVLFQGGKGAADNVRAKATHVTASRLDVKVPAAARTGKLSVTSADGQTSKATAHAVKIAQPDGVAAPKLAAASADVDARVTSTKVYYYGRKRAVLQYLLKGSAGKDVRVDLVRTSDSRSVAHWFAYDVPAGTPQTISWNGKSGSVVPRMGRYQFRIATGSWPKPAQGSTKVVQSSSASDPPPPATAAAAGSFAFMPWVFPIRGAHSYGMSAGRFGAGRAGHTHQGQDVFAKCGTPLVAARGGTVRWKAYHSAAGNYLVINSAGTGVDTTYMHLREPSPLQKGQKVYTGQLIGYVGDTGDAVGCHLHFEMWSAPGWYEGGSPFDPLSYLKAWDRYS